MKTLSPPIKLKKCLGLIIALCLVTMPDLKAEQIIKTYIDNQWSNSRYVVHGDGTVSDTQTGLMWKVCSEGQTWSQSNGTPPCSGSAIFYTWKDTLERVNSYTFASYSDWRVPNIKELASLVAEDRSNPSINASIFPATPAKQFWSSSPFATTAGDDAWIVNFSSGYDSYSRRNGSNRLRLVRVSQ